MIFLNFWVGQKELQIVAGSWIVTLEGRGGGSGGEGRGGRERRETLKQLKQFKELKEFKIGLKR